MAQVNFNITEEAKASYDKALELSGAENKPEFFKLMLEAFTTHQASNVDTDIDLSKYESVNAQTKEDMSNAFKHIFTLIDANLSITKAEAIYIDTQKKALAEKEEDFISELEKLRANTNAEILIIKTECKETIEEANSQAEILRKKSVDLESQNTKLIKEFNTSSKVAEQVEFISSENKELRKIFDVHAAAHKDIINNLNTKISILDKELIEAKQDLFVAKVEEKSKNKELSDFEKRVNAEKKVVENENKELKKLLKTTEGEFNKALGKLEILEETKKQAL